MSVSEEPTDSETRANSDPTTRGGLRRSTRLLLVLGILGGLNSATLLVLEQPEQLSLATDVYFHAASAMLENGDLYDASPPELPGYRFIYPPIVVALFVPHALLGSETAAFALQTALNVVAGLGIAVVLVRALGRRSVDLELFDRLLLVAFVLLCSWSTNQFVMGQVNLWLALVIALGIDWLDAEWFDRSSEREGSADREGKSNRSTPAGIAFALAALVKLFPATLGLWLVRSRRYRAVGAAIATGVGGLVLGALVFGPDLTVEYLGEVLLERFEGQTFEGTPDPDRNHTTVRRMLAAIFGGSSAIVTPLAFAIVVPPVAYCYRDVSTDARRQAAVLATLVGTLLVMPLQPLYFSFLFLPVVVLAVGLEAGWPRRALFAGTLHTFTFAGPGTVEAVAGPLPDSLGASLVDLGRSVFSVILPPTVGMWLVLTACVLIHARGRKGVDSAS
ncbi:glycosyltransferase family 87 protein [Salinarchaeum laminariae]|uniref:glycosyltransferase family 87 protein n=1 Tax=Salinarchaeum laminariae TaxID=869888 RepID=UPI0020BEF735|nr:glycosyltransferase family 87 protein [Salinarchaeum laminariae]